MHSIWDSPTWHSLGPFTMTPGNLTFSYYIDWFNPFTNKIAGKSASCGAIIMFCLNLPYELQHLPENTFFAGITPPPKEPSVTTMTALADPVVDQLDALYAGKILRTYHHPEGVSRRVGVLPAIGDLLAIRKALGFVGVASHNFCSFCDLHLGDIDTLDPKLWKERMGVDVIIAATQWKQATTKAKQLELFKKNGVRGSSLHRLTYRDPVRHTVLGSMHNWIEGILQHQARFKWGIRIIQTTAPNAEDSKFDTLTPPPSPQLNAFNDIDMLDDEIADLEVESQNFEDSSQHLKRLHTEASILTTIPADNIPSHGSGSDTDFEPTEATDSDWQSDGSERDEAWHAACVFTQDQLAQIHLCLAETVIPAWVERPPINLGQKSHGKLKADQWLKLFSVFLPLILPELWSLTPISSQNHMLLDNFHDLVTCTNILCAYTVSNDSADLYFDHYISYCKSSKVLFPNVKTRPNHHYAMHNRDLLKFWGPLIKLSEFPYEQHNGYLQKVKTNFHICKFYFVQRQYFD